MQTDDLFDNTVSNPQLNGDAVDLNLHIGARLQVFTHRSIKPVEHFSTLIGYAKDEYLVAKLPMSRGVPLSLHDGEKITIRAFTGTCICSFDTNVIRTVLHPFFHTILAFPRQIKNTGLRTAMRVKIGVAAEVSLSDSVRNIAAIPATIINLSLTGALVATRCSLGTEQLMKLSFSLSHNGQETRIASDVLVRNVRPHQTSSSEEEQIYMYGVEFLSLDPLHRMLIQILTYETLFTNRQQIV